MPLLRKLAETEEEKKQLDSIEKLCEFKDTNLVGYELETLFIDRFGLLYPNDQSKILIRC